MRTVAAAGLFAAAAGGAIPSATRFKSWLNRKNGPLPYSYEVVPSSYFDSVAAGKRIPSGHGSKAAKAYGACEGKMVSAADWDAYTFQTETMIAAGGLNIYDGAVWCIAHALLGDPNMGRAYMADVLLGHKTQNLQDVRGDLACKGDMNKGECADVNATGSCGFCYGDTGAKTQDQDHAYFFRTISNAYSFGGTVDKRCPEKNAEWTWNDWKPILGENAWANLLGALGTAYLAYGKNAAAIPDNVPEMTLAGNLIPTLVAMKVKASGLSGTPVYYAPRNTYFYGNPDAGSTVSTENQASLLAGLKGFRYVLEQKDGGTYHHLLGDVNSLISGIETYFRSAWTGKFFRQGGAVVNNKWQWHQGDSPEFAVDCQTWSASVLGSDFIDGFAGDGATRKLWDTVKSKAGYKKSGSKVSGVGYTENSYAGEVFSGEWTFGAINWLRIMAGESSYTAQQKDSFLSDATYMRNAIESELTHSGGSVLYANTRYYIPFGWWANNIPATASTAWAVFADMNHNPFLLTGAYSSSYNSAPAPPAPAPSSAACSANAKCLSAGLGGNCCPSDQGVTLDCCQ